jgi:hypothetical protein
VSGVGDGYNHFVLRTGRGLANWRIVFCGSRSMLSVAGPMVLRKVVILLGIKVFVLIDICKYGNYGS